MKRIIKNKKILLTMLSVCVISSLMIGCGKKVEKKTINNIESYGNYIVTMNNDMIRINESMTKDIENDKNADVSKYVDMIKNNYDELNNLDIPKECDDANTFIIKSYEELLESMKYVKKDRTEYGIHVQKSQELLTQGGKEFQNIKSKNADK